MTNPRERPHPYPPPEPLWPTPLLSTTEPDAIDAYRTGVAALVAGLPGADQHLQRLVGIDPTFVLGRVALAAAVATMTGSTVGIDGPPGPVTRGERQHVEIVTATLDGDPRAADLRREHLREFPGDLLIVWLPLAFPRRPAGSHQ